MSERCTKCGLLPPPKPRCHMCQRPMEDWPDDPELFLVSRGWEQAPYNPGSWMEPAERATFEVTEEMVEESRRRLTNAQTYLEYPSVQKSGERRRQAQETVRIAQANLDELEGLRERGERTDLQSTSDRRFRGTDRLGEVVTEKVVTQSRRTRVQFPLDQAFRHELNRSIPVENSKTFKTLKYTPQEIGTMRHTMIFRDKGSLTQTSLSQLADMQEEVCESHVEQCVACRRWPLAAERLKAV